MGRNDKSRSKSHIKTIDMTALEKLVNGDELLTYKELCDRVNISPLTGNAKIKQMKELLTICDYEKKGHKYDFIRLRNSDEIISYSNKMIYSPYIEYWISEAFYDHTLDNHKVDGILYLSIMDIMVGAGLVNNNFPYVKGKYNENKRRLLAYLHYEDFTFSDIDTFTNVSYYDILKPIVRNALISMDNRDSIRIERAYKLYRQRKGDDDKKYYEYTQFSAVSKDGEQMLKLLNDALKYMGIKNRKELFTQHRDKLEEYYETCTKLCKERFGYDGFYDCYGVVADRNKIRYNIHQIKKELNVRVIKRVEAAKQLKRVTSGGKVALINALINLNTKYDFQADIENHYNKKY